MMTNGGRNCRMFYQSDATLKHMLQMLQRYFPLVPVINLQVATNTNTNTNTHKNTKKKTKKCWQEWFTIWKSRGKQPETLESNDYLGSVNLVLLSTLRFLQGMVVCRYICPEQWLAMGRSEMPLPQDYLIPPAWIISRSVPCPNTYFKQYAFH